MKLKVLINNPFIDDNNPSLFETEVRINEKIPLSTHKGDSITGGEEDFTQNELVQKGTASKQKQSNQPIGSLKEEKDIYFDNLKESEKEGAAKTSLTTKKSGKKKGKVQKGINNSKVGWFKLSSQ